MSYKKLRVWQLAREVSLDIHIMTSKLPKFEQYEEGQQIRRSSKSVRSNIVEGYGRRYYKGEYMKFIVYALASNDETFDHLETLIETKSLTDASIYNGLLEKIVSLGKQLNKFLAAINDGHTKPDI
jgi:four helix bundle protein